MINKPNLIQCFLQLLTVCEVSDVAGYGERGCDDPHYDVTNKRRHKRDGERG